MALAAPVTRLPNNLMRLYVPLKIWTTGNDVSQCFFFNFARSSLFGMNRSQSVTKKKRKKT